MDSDGFFGADSVGTDEEFDRYGRYMLDVDGQGKKAYTRATTIAKTLESTFHLDAWKQKNAAKGVAQRPDLVARAAVTPIDDKKNWAEILGQAEVIAAGGAKANLGTAFHALHEHVGEMSDEEYAAVPADLRELYEKYRAELARLGIREVATELTVAATQIGVAGKADAVFQLADGRQVIGDRKSGQFVRYPHAPAMQLAIYANATHAQLDTDDPKFLPMAALFPKLDKTLGIIVDVKFATATEPSSVHVYELDLTAGWWAALEACKVRRWRNRKDLITPFQPEHVPAPQFVTQGAASGGVYTDEQAAQQKRWGLSAQQVVDGEHKDLAAKIRDAAGPLANTGTELAKIVGHPAWSSAQEKVIQLANDGTELPAPITLDEQGLKQVDGKVDHVQALLADKRYKTKAHMQAAARRLDPNMPVNRTRANLAADMVAHPSWASMWHSFLPLPVDPDSASPPPVEQDPSRATDPEPDGQSYPEISGAGVPTPVVQSEFPNAGLPAQDEAPVSESNPFTAPPADPPHAPMSEEDGVLVEISNAADQATIAAIWDRCSTNKIPWSARMQQAAQVKMATFN